MLYPSELQAQVTMVISRQGSVVKKSITNSQSPTPVPFARQTELGVSEGT